MSEKADDEFENEYMDLSDDPELAFAQLYRRKYRELEAVWDTREGQTGWQYERRFVEVNRTRTERMSAFVVELCRAASKATEELKPIFDTVDRVFEWIDKARKLRDALPPWEERKKIEPPRKSLPPQSDKAGDLDDDIPF